MPKEKKDHWNWKIAVTAAAATAIAGLAYYLGYEIAKQDCEDQREVNDSQAGPSSALSAEPPEQCSICWKKMKPLKHLSCGHNFHDECISQWLPLSPTCPLCRAKQHSD